MSTHRTRRLRRAVLIAAAAASLAAPAQALSATVDVAGGEIRVTAAKGEPNDVVLQPADNGEIEIDDFQRTPTAGAGCRVVHLDDFTPDNDPVMCSAEGVEGIAVALGDKTDQLLIYGRVPPVSYSGGTGSDSISYVAQDLGPISVSLDGVANDGHDGRDNIAADVETIYGTLFDGDLLIGGPSATTIDGGDGDDDLRGGPGNDTISAATVPDTGLASGFLFENGKDKVSCGDGNDQVFADRHDTVASDCEVVGRPWRLTSSGDNYLYTGSRQSDTIVVRQFVNAIVKAGAGDDLVRLENDSFGVLYGQAGDDNLRGGTSGDRFSGGPGNDTITSYTRADDRDFVTCGPGHDRVIADRKDRVARDCEKVSRRR